MDSDQGKRRDERCLAEAGAVLIDPRLADVWTALWSRAAACAGEADAESVGFHGQWPEAVVAAALRMAYLQGYGDALTEGEPGSLFRAVGVSGPGAELPGRKQSPRVRRRRGGRSPSAPARPGNWGN